MAKGMSKIEFSTYVKGLRIKAGLTQADVANELKYANSQFVSNWERGLCLPAVSTLPQLSKLFNVNTKVLFNKYMLSLRDELWKKASGEDS
jgi:transcriptional regulator with XRE-family HTH domain